jgi:predicted O-methyltransferase YrrM
MGYSEDKLDELKKISMLHKDTLRMMHSWSQNSKHNVLEIGSYIGGGTIALASGTNRKVIAIEVGGAYNHNMIPSTDILKDLKRNLRSWGVENVKIIAEFSESPKAVELVGKLLEGEKISLIALDSNGSIASELLRYKSFLDSECKIIIDDYLLEGSESNGKNFQVNDETNQLIREGILVKKFVNGWGTFFGTLNLEKLGTT